MEDYASWHSGRLLGTAAHLAERAWGEHLARHGLTMAGFVALHVLRDGPRSQREVAAACHVEDQTMSRTLERLERTGHVARSRDERDRRRVLVSLTPAGRRTAERVAAEAERDLDVFSALQDHERFRRDLVAIISALGGPEPLPPAAPPEPDVGSPP